MLRVIADKTLAKALNEVSLPRIVIDVGSKFKQMDKILDMKGHNSSPALTKAVEDYLEDGDFSPECFHAMERQYDLSEHSI